MYMPTVMMSSTATPAGTGTDADVPVPETPAPTERNVTGLLPQQA
jgi:hypothetical protein